MMPPFMAPNTVPPYIINQSRISNPPEMPTFKKHYGPSRKNWNSLLINKMAKDIKAVLPSEAEFEWEFDKVLSYIQDYIKLVGEKEEHNK
ncbi:unnamed protein product, partial [Rotaria magnacalcarata]